jgi:hypothetical protein
MSTVSTLAIPFRRTVLDAIGVVGLILFAGFVVAIVWLDHAAAKREERDNAELRKQIEHLPVEMQARIWATHIRLKAEKDLH